MLRKSLDTQNKYGIKTAIARARVHLQGTDERLDDMIQRGLELVGEEAVQEAVAKEEQ
jgi:hypothetical protein